MGAGISGLGAVYHLQRGHPQRSYAILEARNALGGPWDLFRSPGVRSDRVLDHLPRQSDRAPWRTSTNYADDIRLLRRLPVTDPQLQRSRCRTSGPAAPDPAGSAA